MASELETISNVEKLFLSNEFSYSTTVKAPNFDRVFMKNIFFIPYFLPGEKIDRGCKIKAFVGSKSKYLF
jgi:hypothetical protein